MHTNKSISYESRGIDFRIKCCFKRRKSYSNISTVDSLYQPQERSISTKQCGVWEDSVGKEAILSTLPPVLSSAVLSPELSVELLMMEAGHLLVWTLVYSCKLPVSSRLRKYTVVITEYFYSVPICSLCSIYYAHVLSCSVVSDSLQPHGLQPSRLLCP